MLRSCHISPNRAACLWPMVWVRCAARWPRPMPPLMRRDACDAAICTSICRAHCHDDTRVRRLPQLLLLPRLRSTRGQLQLRRVRHPPCRLCLRRRMLRLLGMLGRQLQHLQWWRSSRRRDVRRRLSERRTLHRGPDQRVVDAACRVCRLKISGSNGSFGCHARNCAP